MTQPRCFEQFVQLRLFGTMTNLEIFSPYFLTSDLPTPPNNGYFPVSTSIQKLTEEKGNTLPRLLALHIHPDQIALLTGAGLGLVYCWHENCPANAGIYEIPEEPSHASHP